MDTIFDDSDIPLGDSLTYSFSVLNGLLNASITGNELQIHSVSDSNGVASVIVIATDTSHASVNDTFEVNINPVNDAPASLTYWNHRTVCANISRYNKFFVAKFI